MSHIATCAQGMAGPVSNLMQSMGVKLPENKRK